MILVISGYPSTPYTIRPFDEPEIAAASPVDQRRMREFNRRLSSVRIASEHAYGKLKGRFPSLKEMGPHRDMDETYNAIEALLILHNISIEWSDNPERIWDFDPTDPGVEDDGDEREDGDFCREELDGEAVVPAHESDAWLKVQGRRKRQLLFDELF